MRILKHWIKVTTCRSSGPGGQNVNKVNTKVDMRLDLKWLAKDVVEKIKEQQPGKVNKYHQLFVSSDSSRSQADNYNTCLEKLQDIIDHASNVQIQEQDPNKMEIIKGHIDKFNRDKFKDKKMNSLKKYYRQSKRDDSW